MNHIGKTISVILILMTFNQSAHSQYAYEKGKHFFSLGYGYENISAKDIMSIYREFPNYKLSGFGPVTFKYEYGIGEKVGIGLSVGYTTAKVTFNDEPAFTGDTPYNYQYTYYKFSALPRITYHFGEYEKLDPYIVFGAGYKKVSFKGTTNDPDFDPFEYKGIPMSFNLAVGARYYFNEQFGIWAETGAGHGGLQFGAVYKIGNSY